MSQKINLVDWSVSSRQFTTYVDVIHPALIFVQLRIGLHQDLIHYDEKNLLSTSKFLKNSNYK